MKIDLDILASAISTLLSDLKEQQGAVIDIPEEVYWFVQKDELYDATKIPSQLTLGAISDDWGYISEIGRGEQEAIVFALVWASTILRLLGDR